MKNRIKNSLPGPLSMLLSNLRNGIQNTADRSKRRSLKVAGRAGEALKYSLVRPRTYYNFVVVSPERNAGAAGRKCLQSVYEQDYDKSRVRHIFIDDASIDDTPERIKTWMKEHPDNTIELIENREQCRLLANLVKGFDMASPGSIVIELDGDDWLPDKNVLKFLNKVYQKDNVWMTYNTFIRLISHSYTEFPNMMPVPERVIKDNSFRNYKWQTSHLHSFRKELYQNIDKKYFIEPESGFYWSCAVDHALYLPMLELAGWHSRHIYRIMYIYNFHENSLENTDKERQRQSAQKIRQMPPLQPLEELSGPAGENWKGEKT